MCPRPKRLSQAAPRMDYGVWRSGGVEAKTGIHRARVFAPEKLELASADVNLVRGSGDDATG